MSRRRPRWAALIALIAATSCQTSTAVTPPVGTAVSCTLAAPSGARIVRAEGIVLMMIPPRLTDACIDVGVDSHVVFRPDRPAPASRLLLFLGGTGSSPRHYQQILLAASRAGYHAIGLVYPNSLSVSVRCAAEPMVCYRDTRLEALTGESRSGAILVNRANSIEYRLLAALGWLATHDPGGHWSEFAQSDSVVAWNRLSVAGHSQGGGFALFIAQRHELFRASVYASYGDYLPITGEAADWVTQAYATPSRGLFGFISTREDAISLSRALATWSRIGMSGVLVDADSMRTAGDVPVGQRYVTSQAPASLTRTPAPFHDMVVLDAQTPTDSRTGLPVFAGIWKAISFP